MGKMYQWKPEMIRFMDNSANYTKAYEKMANAIAPWLPKGGHICEAGCGLGHLSLALSQKGFFVTAVDVAPQVISGQTPNASLELVVDDIFTMTPQNPYDAMVFCMFGSEEQILQLAKTQCKGTVVVLRRQRREARFSIQSHRAGCHTLEALAQQLECKNIPYKQMDMVFEMGQPLKDNQDAVDFFRLYSRDAHPETIEFPDIANRLVPESSGQYRWYLPLENQFGMLQFETKDLCE